MLLLFSTNVIICHPETTDDVCFSLSRTIRDEVVGLGSLSFSLELCVGRRDSRGGNHRKDREEDTVICRRKTHMLLALKDAMDGCMDPLSREQSTPHNRFPSLALPDQVFFETSQNKLEAGHDSVTEAGRLSRLYAVSDICRLSNTLNLVSIQT